MSSNKNIQELFDKASKILEDYIVLKKLRRTPERNYLLKLIYDRNDHFGAEDLFHAVDKNQFNVSKATVYNSLELFLECGIITRHYLNNNTSIYEKAYGFKQHDHFICQECKKIIEFCDPRLYQIKKSLEEVLNVEINSHQLYLYGVCGDKGCKGKRKV
ncbi:MAG: transcriptional repressor [Chitinophagales bacterium]|nr:transcriptional repressor [Chitinophagales bacterium]